MMKSASRFEYPSPDRSGAAIARGPDRPVAIRVDEVTLSDDPGVVLPFACGEGHPMPHPAKPASTKNPVAVAVGLPDAPVLTTRAARGTGMAFLELNCERRNAGITQAVREDAFLIALQMKTCPDFDLYADGRLILPKGFDADEIAIFDLRTNLATDLRDPFHAVDFYLPHKALVAMGDDGDIPRYIQELRHTLGTTVRDPVARDLLLSMRPALAARPEETPELFVDHVALALSIHVALRYGDVAALPKQWGGGLAPWQER
jgi:AraC family transcriptional regulator